MTVIDVVEGSRPSADEQPGPTGAEWWTPRRTWGCVALVLSGFVAISLTTERNANPFQDEGLYLFMGHRMIDHFLTGVKVTEYPGTYFSGAPGIYPVIAAMTESVFGLDGARVLSLFFASLAIVGAFGIGRELFGTAAGLFGAAAISLCGSIIFISNLATFDAMALALIALAAWLAVYSAKRDRLIWAPVVGVLLAAAFLTKYATAVYVPGICALALLAVWPSIRWAAFRRIYVIVAAAIGVVLLVLTYWAYDIRKGILSTTLDRHPISPAPPSQMASNVALWVGPWLILAVVGAVVAYRRWPVCLVLLGMSVVGPLQQIRIGEATSLSKHVGFGLVFAAPLIGALAVGVTKYRWRLLGAPLIVCIAVALGASGMANGARFQTTWVDDSQLLAQLRKEIAISPGKAILGEEPSAQRYALRHITKPSQWNDTFVLLYGGKSGMPAYQEAINQTHFGTIYLTLNTTNGKKINQYLAGNATPYRLSAKVPSFRRGEPATLYLIWTPKVLLRLAPR